jgi:hypothetical protein
MDAREPPAKIPSDAIVPDADSAPLPQGADASLGEPVTYCWVVYNVGCTYVSGIYSSEEKAVKAYKSGKAELPEYNYDPADGDVVIYKTPMNRLVSIGFGCETCAEFVEVPV